MARFNQKTRAWDNQGGSTFPATGAKSQTTTSTNHEGRTTWLLDAKTELFLRSTTAFAGQDSFYEKAAQRDARAIELVRELAVKDWNWTSRFLVWLRKDGNMRTMPIMLAAEAVRARVKSGLHGDVTGGMTHRELIDGVLQRADEPGEMMAYYENVLGRMAPIAVRRGVGDAAKRLYSERNFLRYNSDSRALGFGAVAELAQMPKTHDWQYDLIKYAIDVQHGHDTPVPDSLPAISCRFALNQLTRDARHAYARDVINGTIQGIDFRAAMAGQWEWVRSWLGDTKGVKNPVTEKEQWELVAPQLGIMAAVRNLRNLDEAGFRTGDRVVQEICARLTDKDQIARSRMFPFRFYTAYKELKSVTWAGALEVAAQLALSNVPTLPGKTLVLVDTSSSMTNTISGKSVMSFVEIAALFGTAMKLANPDNVSLWGWADGQFECGGDTGYSLLRCTEDLVKQVGSVGHGTNMERAIRATYTGHDRVVMFSDMQAFNNDGSRYHGGYWGVGDVGAAVPARIPIYAFNLSAGSTTPFGKGKRHALGGMTDVTLKQIALIESVGHGKWPWE